MIIVSELGFGLGLSTVVVGTFKYRHFHRDRSGLPWVEDMFLCSRVVGVATFDPTPADNENEREKPP